MDQKLSQPKLSSAEEIIYESMDVMDRLDILGYPHQENTNFDMDGYLYVLTDIIDRVKKLHTKCEEYLKRRAAIDNLIDKVTKQVVEEMTKNG